MVQTTVRKGFFFYFGLFFLLVFAAFMICLCIMMFNPGKTVLWMKYFTDNREIMITKANGANIDFGSLTEIDVSCDFADVVVQCNKTYDKTGIVIVSNAKCFGTKKSKDFSYKVTLDGTKLNIDVHEPEGFLYFSKNIKVIVNSRENWHFGSDMKLKVVATGNSNIYIGGNSTNQEKNIELKSVDLKTAKGQIMFRKTGNVGNMTNGIVADCGSGSITTDSALESFNVSSNVTFNTTTGKINIKQMNLGDKELSLVNEKGAVAIGTITAKKINIDCVQSNFAFTTINGDVSFSGATDKLISPNIAIGTLNGNFNLSASANKVSPEIKINRITGELVVNGKKGKVVVKEAQGKIVCSSDDGMALDIIVADGNNNKIDIHNGKGDIKLGFKGSVSSDVDVITESSEVVVNFTAAAKFTAKAMKNDIDLLEESHIKTPFGVSPKNNFTIGEGAGLGSIEIQTTDEVYYNLVSSV